MNKKFPILCFILITGFVIIPTYVKAQTSIGLESRLARLESENLQLRSQISRIESQLGQLQGRTSSSTSTFSTTAPPPNTPSVPYRGSRSTLSADPMFQRLANLVIELKERVQAVEAQVAQFRGQRKR